MASRPPRGVVEGELEEVALGGDVVVDGRFRDAQVLGEDAHGGGVVAVAVEDVDGDEQYRLLVVAGPAALVGDCCSGHTGYFPMNGGYALGRRS